MTRPLSASLVATLLILAAPAAAEVPMEVYPDCGSEPDRPDLCPVDLGEAWHLISYVRDTTTLIFTNSPTFADLDGDGIDEVIDGGIGIGYITSRAVDFKRIEFDHFINVWDVEDGRMEYGFPQQIEGLQFFQNPAVA